MEWKVLTEEKPKKDGWYLITYEVPDGSRYVCESFYNKKRKIFIDRDEYIHLKIVAWAEMPSPYKEQNEL